MAGVDQLGTTGVILKTSDGGASWIQQTSGVKFQLWSVYFTDLYYGWIVGDRGDTILSTTNSGMNWIKNYSMGGLRLHSVNFPSPSVGWTVGETGSIKKYSETDPNIRINLSVLFEGKYLPSPGYLSTIDSVTVFLRDASSPFALRDSSKRSIDSLNFSGDFTFFDAPTGLYYIVVKHFQCIETWSKAGGDSLFADNVLRNYSFADSASQAYQSNMRLKGAKYCIYSGDLDNSGFIDGTDVALIGNDALNYVTGRYLLTDINGDLIVDGSDNLIADNNAFDYVEVRRPL